MLERPEDIQCRRVTLQSTMSNEQCYANAWDHVRALQPTNHLGVRVTCVIEYEA
jgi:hypothetical protein